MARSPALLNSRVRQGGGGSSLLMYKRPVGSQDSAHATSERILSEIISILKSAGASLTAQLPGINDDPEQAKAVLRKVINGGDEARITRAIRDLSRLRVFAGTEPWKVDAHTLCAFFLHVSKGGRRQR